MVFCPTLLSKFSCVPSAKFCVTGTFGVTSLWKVSLQNIGTSLIAQSRSRWVGPSLLQLGVGLGEGWLLAIEAKELRMVCWTKQPSYVGAVDEWCDKRCT